MAVGIASGSIAWTASEAKNTEKKTSAFSLGGLPISGVQIQFERSMSNTAGMVTLNLYNVSKIDGTNARDTLMTQNTVSTTVAYKAVNVTTGASYGTEETFKIGAIFAANVTGSGGAGTLYYKIFHL